MIVVGSGVGDRLRNGSVRLWRSGVGIWYSDVRHGIAGVRDSRVSGWLRLGGIRDSRVSDWVRLGGV